eukprot:262350-Ditylum_brightwellii.AAC.1
MDTVVNVPVNFVLIGSLLMSDITSPSPLIWGQCSVIHSDLLMLILSARVCRMARQLARVLFRVESDFIAPMQ